MILVDTHCHLNFSSFDEDRAEVIARAHQAGVHHIIIPAIDLETCQQALALADSFPNVYVALGIHPNSTVDFEEKTLDTLQALSAHKQVVAIGEIGLDYYWDKSPKEQQLRAFRAQLKLAQHLQLPVIIHNRNADEDTIAVLEDWFHQLPDMMKVRAGVLHSFSGSAEMALRALKIGFYIGFTGPITFKKADDLRAIAAVIPLEAILVETDAPFLTPHPHRGKRNEPAYIPLIVEQLASVKGISREDMARHTTENASRLFKL